jgi:hypothetical protein
VAALPAALMRVHREHPELVPVEPAAPRKSAA